MTAGAIFLFTVTATIISTDPLTATAEVTASDQPDPDSTPNNHVPGEDDQASVVVDANGPPVAKDDSGVGFTTNEDLPFVTANVLANDTDPDHDTLSVTAFDTTGTKGLVADNHNGTFTYDPHGQFEPLDTGETATDTFTYTVSDGHLTATATVTITITGVNDPPVAVSDSYTATEDTMLTVTAPAGVLANDTDPEGDTLTAVLVTGVTHGSLTLNTADGSFTYDPVRYYHGGDSFTYRAMDDGGLPSNLATVTINFIHVNHVPVAADMVVKVTRDAAKTFNLQATDVDGDPLTYSLASGPTTTNGGSVVLNGLGPGVTYTPPAGYVGPDSFTFTANDGALDSNTATVTITVAKKKGVWVGGDGGGGCRLSAVPEVGAWLWYLLALGALTGLAAHCRVRKRGTGS